MTIRGMDTTTAKQPPSGCVRCKREWPNARFSQEAEAVARGEKPEHICDLCLEFASDAISEAIDEAQGVAPTNQIVREVSVTGIVSRKNIVGWRYVTFRSKPLTFTDLDVEFKGPKLYRYLGVPVVVIEAMIGAASIGSFFSEQIQNSYQCQKL